MVGRNNITFVLRAPGDPRSSKDILSGHPTLCLLCGQDQTQPDTVRRMPRPTTTTLPQPPPPAAAACFFLLILLTGTISVTFLLRATARRTGSQLPQVLRVSVGQKLVAAYILGLLTKMFLQAEPTQALSPTQAGT